MPVDRPASGSNAYTDALIDAFGAAIAEQSEPWIRTFRVGGRSVEVQAAGAGIGDGLTEALHHLKVAGEGARPVLSVHLWNQAGSVQQVPLPPWLRNTHPDEQWRYDDGRTRILIHRESPYSRTYMLLLDREQGRAVYWISDFANIPYWEVANPLRLMFSWWAEAAGMQLLHAGAAGDRRGAVLFVGNAGSGKSSSALACLDAGLDFLGDDLVMLELGDRPIVHSLYATAKLKADNIHRFPSLQPAITNLDRGEDDKAILFLHRDHGPKLVFAREVRALVVPRIVSNASTRVFPISQGAALRALAPSTIKLLGADGGALGRMADLVRRVPLFGLEIGPRSADIPKAIEPLLDIHGG